MFVHINPAELRITAAEQSRGYENLHCTHKRSQAKLTLKRNIADTRRTIQEFALQKKAHTVASGVVEPYQMVLMNGGVYMAAEAMHITLQSAFSNRRCESPEAEDELLHKLLKLLTTVHSLHSAHIAHGCITSQTIWDDNNALKLGGFESAREVETTELESAFTEDCKMVGVVLVEVLTNTYNLHTRRTEECIKRLKHPCMNYRCLLLLPVAERLLIGEHLSMADALRYFQVIKQHPPSNALTMRAKRCAVCRKWGTAITKYPCPRSHYSCSNCFNLRALSISRREFDESDFRCILCEDTVIPPDTFLSLVTDTTTNVALGLAIKATFQPLPRADDWNRPIL